MRISKSFFMAILISFFYFNLSNVVFAVPQEISAVGEYRLGDSDSREMAKKAALADAKRKIMEQAGILIESYTEVNNFHVTKDQIRTTAKTLLKVKSEDVEFSENGTLCKVSVVAIIDADNIGKTLESEVSKSNDSGNDNSSKEYKNYTNNKKAKVSNVKSGNAYIPKNIKIIAELMGTFSSKDTRKGDKIPFKLVNDLIINDIIVAKAGTEIKGVCSFRKGVNILGGGALQFKMLSFETVNGKEVPLKSTTPILNIDDNLMLTSNSFLFKSMVWSEGTRFKAKVASDTDLNITWSELADIEEVF